MDKYPLSYGQTKYEFLQYFLLWAGLSDDVNMGTMLVLKSKLWWLLG